MSESPKCYVCGAPLNQKNIEMFKGYVCPYCGEEIPLEIDDNISKLMNYVVSAIKEYNFDGAKKECDEILNDEAYKTNPLANWCALLASNKIAYLKNNSDEYEPTFLNPNIKPITDSPYYKGLGSYYMTKADDIESKRREIVRQLNKIAVCDVFISYKQRSISDSSQTTPEKEWAYKLYETLRKKKINNKKIKVFLNTKSLNVNADWEPTIYSAISSARLMVVMASSLENINSDWVKNEWKRFISLRECDNTKDIAVVCSKGIDAEKLPDPALKAKNVITFDGNGRNLNGKWLNYVVERVEYACDPAYSTDRLLDEADAYLIKKKFGKANKLYFKAAKKEPGNARAQWGILKCKLRALDDYDIIINKNDIRDMDEYKAIVRGNIPEEEKDIYRKVQKAQNAYHNAQNAHDDAQKNHIAGGYGRPNYYKWKKATRGMRIFKGVTLALCILLVAAGGVYCYWEYSHPLRFSIADGQATLDGTGLFFDYSSTEELNVDTYDGYQVTSIGDYVFSGSNVKTVNLAASVQQIGVGAFENSSGLTALSMGDTVTIGDDAFSNCTSLASVTFGGDTSDESAARVRAGGAISIGEGAFENCISLGSIILSGVDYIGADAFKGCSNLKEVYIDGDPEIQISSGAFDDVSDSFVVRVPSVNEDGYNSLVAEYPDIAFETYTLDKVEETVYFIDKIGDISLDSSSDIERAEQLYSALTADEQALVSNYGDLRDARAIYDAAYAISLIGTVTLQSEASILFAEDCYNSLGGALGGQVFNYSELVNARAVFDAMKVIDAIGTVTSQSGELIDRAEEAYAALTEEQQGLVSNYDVLTAAVDTYSVCGVIDAIGAIGTVSENSGPAISYAELLYGGLAPELQGRVTNYSVLRDARAVYYIICAINELDNTITIGSEESIAAAEAQYAALAEGQKPMVSNYDRLADSRTVFAVVEKIEAIGTITADSRYAIEQAESAYSGLNASLQQRVGNRSVLADARAIFDVINLIGLIGEVNRDSGSLIDEAANAYNTLTAAQRAQVINYAVLEEAKYLYIAFDVAELIDAIGTVTLRSGDAIEEAELAYADLDAVQQEKVNNYGKLTKARAVYNLMGSVGSFNSITLGAGQNYSYCGLSASNMVSILNNATLRDEIDSVTFRGLQTIDESEWSAVFDNLSIIRLDVSETDISSTYTVSATVNHLALVGSPSRIYSGFRIEFASRSSDVSLELCDFNMKAAQGAIGIDATGVSSVYNVCIISSGNSSVAGGDGAAGQDGDGYSYNTGYNSQRNGDDGSAGSDGAAGIAGNNISIVINASSSLSVVGGNGGSGGHGGNGGGGAMSDIGQCGHGGHGGDGGTGGNGVEVEYMLAIVDNGTFTATGGTGGNGGNGGRGGNNRNTGTFDRADKGGDGGNGGSGGNGGYGIYSYGIATVSSATTIYVYGGTGGNGGNGNDGGDTTINDWQTSHNIAPGDAGDGGNGGNGGLSSYHISLNDYSGSGGAGGIGGSAGDPGYNSLNEDDKYGADGNPGKAGVAGSF